MKRFMLFFGDRYYPQGGMRDFIGSYNTIEEAVEKTLDQINDYDWFHIYDIETQEIVKEN